MFCHQAPSSSNLNYPPQIPNGSAPISGIIGHSLCSEKENVPPFSETSRSRCNLSIQNSSLSSPDSTLPYYPIQRPESTTPFCPVQFPDTNVPAITIPPPTVSAIISSNKQSVIDRKLRRKAETHKTIPCRAWKDTGRCNYGSKCKFAHGEEDLRKVPEEPAKVYNNPRYRTELCVKFHYLGSCPYGDRCSYIHDPTPLIDLEKCLDELSPPSTPGSTENANSNASAIVQASVKESMKTDGNSTSEDREGERNTPFHDPFTSVDQKEDIELKLLPFMDSFLRRPFFVR